MSFHLISLQDILPIMSHSTDGNIHNFNFFARNYFPFTTKSFHRHEIKEKKAQFSILFIQLKTNRFTIIHLFLKLRCRQEIRAKSFISKVNLSRSIMSET